MSSPRRLHPRSLGHFTPTCPHQRSGLPGLAGYIRDCIFAGIPSSINSLTGQLVVLKSRMTVRMIEADTGSRKTSESAVSAADLAPDLVMQALAALACSHHAWRGVDEWRTAEGRRIKQETDYLFGKDGALVVECMNRKEVSMPEGESPGGEEALAPEHASHMRVADMARAPETLPWHSVASDCRGLAQLCAATARAPQSAPHLARLHSVRSSVHSGQQLARLHSPALHSRRISPGTARSSGGDPWRPSLTP